MTRCFATLAFALSLVLFATARPAADEPATPKFSKFAPAADLGKQLEMSLVDLGKATVTPEEYQDEVDRRFERDGHTIELVALALGLHDEANPYKAKAGAIIAAAKVLAATKDYEATKKAVEGLKAAMEGDSKDGAALKWGKVAPLPGLMKDEVPAINNKLKTNTKPRNFKKRSAEVAAGAAAVALIAENAKLYVGDTKYPDKAKEWNDFAEQMQAAAVQLGAAAKKQDESAAKTAMDDVLDASCHACHKVFHPEEEKKTKE